MNERVSTTTRVLEDLVIALNDAIAEHAEDIDGIGVRQCYCERCKPMRAALAAHDAAQPGGEGRFAWFNREFGTLRFDTMNDMNAARSLPDLETAVYLTPPPASQPAKQGEGEVRHCPHATSSPLRYCDPCPVSPCPMESAATLPAQADGEVGEPVALVLEHALTVVIPHDNGAARADASIAAIKSGGMEIVHDASEMYFHQLRLRVQQEPALAKSIKVYYRNEHGKLEPVGLGFDEEMHWPQGFLRGAWEKEREIQLSRATHPAQATIKDGAAQAVVGGCTCPQHGEWIAAADVNRMAREIDVAVNGEWAAKAPALCDIAASVIAEIASLRDNDARYRWIRDNKHMEIAACWLVTSDTPYSPQTPEQLDAAIDTVIRASRGEG